MKLIVVCVVLISVFTIILASDRYDVAENCGNSIHMHDDDDVVHLSYHGASLSERCTIKIIADDHLNVICAEPKKFDLDSCITVVLYRIFDDDFKEYSCFSKQVTSECSHTNKMEVTFIEELPFEGDNVELTISIREGIFSEAYRDNSMLVKVVVMPIILILSVILIAICVVIGICCFMRRRDSQNRARLAVQAKTTTVTYPMPNQSGYQSQAGYGQSSYLQPSQQAGFQQSTGYKQPPSPMGYQQLPPSPGYQQPFSPMDGQRPLSFSSYEKPPSPTKFNLPSGTLPRPAQQSASSTSITETSPAPLVQPPPYSG